MPPTMPPTELRDLLQLLRQQALAGGPDKAFSGERRSGVALGSHQLEAHLSVCRAAGQAAEPWELYRMPWLHTMPRTSFYAQHAAEIQEAVRPASTWEFLDKHAVPKAQLEASMTEAQYKLFGYPGRVQFYDFAVRGWRTIDVPAVRWFDGREVFRDGLVKAEDALRAGVLPTLEKAQAWGKRPSDSRMDAIEAALADAKRKLVPMQDWLKKLDATPDFGKAVFALLRGAENEVRRCMGVPAVGEGWVSEAELLYRVRRLLPGVEVVHHGRPLWLSKGQHIDIWVPDRLLAIEYQGITHFQPVERFGGAAGLEHRKALDERKRKACAHNGVRLLEIHYDQQINDAALQALLEGSA